MCRNIVSFKGSPEEFFMGTLVLLVEGIPQLMILAMAMTHWHSEFQTVAIELFCTAVNIPLSVLYLGFYCNPRVQLAVVSKILLEGLHSSACLYGEYIEEYLHDESKPLVGEDARIVDDNDTTKNSCFKSYDISSVLNVTMYHIIFIILVPFVGLREIGIALWHSLIRDFGGRKKNVVNSETNDDNVKSVSNIAVNSADQ